MRDRECRVMVSNVPEHAEKYIVARVSGGFLWYWGSWGDKDDAEESAKNVEGIVVIKGW